MLIGIGCAFSLLAPADAETSKATTSVEKRLSQSGRKVPKSFTRRKAGRDLRDGHATEVAIAVKASTAAKPQIDPEDEEDSLTPLQKSVLQSLRDALDNDNLRAVRKAIAKFRTCVPNRKGSAARMGEEVPRIMREEAVAALKWFGAKTVEDLMDFATDSDEDISSDAFEGVMDALNDGEMSDYRRSELVKVFLHTVTDEDIVDSLLDQLMDMRNSVKAETALDILGNGTEEAKRQLLEELEIHFDEDVSSEDDIKRWELQNPDEPEDEELYGGVKE